MATMLNTIADELREHGDECEVGAWTLRLTIEPDEWVSPFDYPDSLGRLAWVNTNRHTGQHEPRPDGFDGAACIIHGGQRSFDPCWWQPPEGVKPGTDEYESAKAYAWERLNFGYSVVTVEAFRHRDLYGRPCVEAVASLGGVDDIYPALVAELVAEVLDQIGEES